MRPHPRARKTAKWLLTTCALSLTIATITSYWYVPSLRYCTPSRNVIGTAKLSRGIIRWSRFWQSSFHTSVYAWDFSPPTDPPLPWTWRVYESSPIATHITLPLFIPATLAAIPAALLWWRDLQIAARSRIGHCPTCGYDRKGLTANAKCPECGRSEQAT